MIPEKEFCRLVLAKRDFENILLYLNALYWLKFLLIATGLWNILKVW